MSDLSNHLYDYDYSEIMNGKSYSGLSTGTWTMNGGISPYIHTYLEKEITFDELFEQVNDSSLPIIDEKEWTKISEMLSSSDMELIKLGFELLSGHRFPRGVMNIITVHNAINKYLKELNKQ